MRMAKNSIYSIVAALVPVAIMLVTVPLFLRTIGAERYGVLAIFWLILLYAGQADFGIGRAVIRRTAQLGEVGSLDASRVVWSAVAVVSALSLFLAFLTVAFSWWYFADPFDAPTELRIEALGALPYLGAGIIIVAIFGVFQAMLTGQNRFGMVAVASSTTNILIQLLPLACAIFVSPRLPELVLATLVGRLVGLMLSFGFAWTRGLSSHSVKLDRAEIREMLHFGKWVMITVMTRPLMVTIDRMVIGVQLGAVAVAAYTIPFQVASRLQVLPQAIWQVMFVRLAGADDDTAFRLGGKYLSMLAAFSAPLTAVLICMAGPLLQLWLGDQLDPRSVLVARILLGQFWLAGIAMAALGYLYSRGETRFGALVHLIEAPIYVFVLLLVATYFGLVGVALAFTLRMAIESGILSWKSGFADHVDKSVIASLAIVLAISVALDPILTGWWPSLAAAVSLGGATALIAFRTVPLELRGQLRGWLRF